MGYSTLTLTVSDGTQTTAATFDQDVRVANPSAVGIPNVGQDVPSGTVGVVEQSEPSL